MSFFVRRMSFLKVSSIVSMKIQEDNTLALQSVVEKEALKDKQNDIKKTKKILDYIDNPKLFWRNLKTSVKNMFIQRYLVQKEILKETSKNQVLNLHQIIKSIRNSCEFARILKTKLSIYNDEITVNNEEQFTKHVMKLTKEIFKYWFYSKGSTGDLDATMKLEVLDRRESFASEPGDEQRLMNATEFFS